MSNSSSPSRSISPTDPAAVALIEQWNNAVRECENLLHDDEKETIRLFHSPQQLEDDLRQRLHSSAQGKLKGIVSRVSPFFDILQDMLRLFTAAMPARSIPLTLVSGGAYLTVKYCADFDTATDRILKCLDKFQEQLQLFYRYSEVLEHQTYRRGLVEMFIALIKFWVATLRFMTRTNRLDKQADSIVRVRWPQLLPSFYKALDQMVESVNYVSKLQEAARTNSFSTKAANAQTELLKQLPDVDLAGDVFPCYEFPVVDHNFLGRTEPILNTKRALIAGKPTSLNKVVISGMAGVGKSAVARVVAQTLKEAKKYDAILWINAETPEVLRDSFTKIACRLQLKGANESSDKETNFMLVKNWLDKTMKTWLLIYDNVEEYDTLKEYLPPDRGSVIVTTRYQALTDALGGNAFRVELNKLNIDESLHLFNHIRVQKHPQAAVDKDKQETIELLEVIDGLTLGVKQMAHFIGSKKWTISRFRERYEKMAGYILEYKEPSASNTLGTLWAVQFEDIESDPSSKLLGLLSLCAPDNIPRQLFELEEALPYGSYADFCDDDECFERAIDGLENKALIEVDRDADDETFSVHRLTQQAFLNDKRGLADPTSSAVQEAFDALVQLIDRKFPRYGRDKSLLEHWNICARYLPHVSNLAHVFKASKKKARSIETSELFAELLKNASWYLQEIGELEESEKLVEVGFDACRSEDSLTYAYLCNTKVVLAMDTNKLADGRNFSEKAIAIREKLLASDDLDLAISYGNFANILTNEELFDEALANHTLSDDIWMGAGKIDDTYKGLSHLNTGRVYSMKGNPKVAASYFKQAEDIFSKSSNSMFLIGVHYTWATLLMNQNENLDALARFQIAYALAKDSIPFQIVVASLCYKLAVLHTRMDLFTEAKERLEEGMTISEYHKREEFIARIGRQWALTIDADPTSTDKEKDKAAEMRKTSEDMRLRLWEQIKPYVKDAANVQEEEQYRWLLAAWYR